MDLLHRFFSALTPCTSHRYPRTLKVRSPLVSQLIRIISKHCVLTISTLSSHTPHCITGAPYGTLSGRSNPRMKIYMQSSEGVPRSTEVRSDSIGTSWCSSSIWFRLQYKGDLRICRCIRSLLPSRCQLSRFSRFRDNRESNLRGFVGPGQRYPLVKLTLNLLGMLLRNPLENMVCAF